MRRVALASVIFASIIGCGSGNERASRPSSGRLEAGSEAIAVGESKNAGVLFYDSKGKLNGITSFGVRMLVIADEEQAPKGRDDLRFVPVRLLEGERKDEIGKMYRMDIRPVKRP